MKQDLSTNKKTSYKFRRTKERFIGEAMSLVE
jgi:hypothetical protein